MKVRFIFPALMAMMLCGCAQFSKSHFIEEGFGFDLSPYLEQRDFSYEDGILEMHGVSPDDELYKKIFKDNTGMHSDQTLFVQNDRQYYASQYMRIQDRQDEIIKFVLYMPEEKTMVFMYADGFGG